MEYESAAEMLRTSRERLGLTQADLAAAMEVNQQSVSRWESGRSRPRKPMALRLAHFLELPDPDAFLTACGHEPGRAAPPRPARPLLPKLPLASIGSADFESFCRDFIKLRHKGCEVNRFGSQGHKQDGIDLIARLPDGASVTFQCKRVEQFGAAKVAQAVQATDVDADQHVLLLSRVASPAARKEIGKHKSWVLWDAEDISSALRFELSLDDSRRLVDTYFPGWREDFLGLTEAGLWLAPDEFFRPAMKRNAVLSQKWDLVGRQSELDVCSAFLASTDQALLMLGRGGSGKTRLLRALVDLASREKPNMTIRFTAREAAFRPHDIEALPSEALVVVDDAHDRDDVESLLVGLARKENVKVVLSARPYALGKLTESLGAAGMIGIDGPRTLELSDIERENLEELARQVLIEGGGGIESAPLIVDATLDSPLFTVIGARLVAAGKADPAGLAMDNTARSLLLASFRDAIVGDIGEPSDQGILRELLRLVAILQPVRADDATFREAAASVLSRHPDILIRHLRTLEEAGIIIRRGRTLRVVPDLLADFLVADASIDPKDGSSTGYADRVFEASAGDIAQNLIINVAKLDWRITREHDARSRVLDQIWEALTSEILGLGALERAALLGALSDISFYQPERSLHLVRQLIDNPVSDEEDHQLLGSFTNDHVLAEVPKFLRGAGYHVEFVGEVADVLWRLGRERPGRLHSEPYHSIRVLAELAEFEPRKPLVYSELLVARAIKWLEDPEVGEYAHSPFDIMQSVLATEGYQTRTKGWTLQMEPYFINAEVVRPLRHRVLDVAIEALQHPDLRVGVRAAAFLEEGLRSPTGLFGRRAGEREQSPWKPEIRRLLEKITEVLTTKSLDPVVKDRLLRSVSWHARFGKDREREAARQITGLAGDELSMKLTRALAHGWAHSAELPEEDDLDYAALEEKWRAYQREVATEIAPDSKLATVRAAIDLIEDRLAALARVGEIDTNPGPFLDVFFAHAPVAAEEVVSRIADQPARPLSRQLHVALGALRNQDAAKALQFAHALLDEGELARSIASAYAWVARANSLSPDEFQLLRTLCDHPDTQTRLNLARGLRFASSLDRATRIELLLNVAIDGVVAIAEEVVGCFGLHGDFAVADLSLKQRSQLLEHLSECPDLDDYQIGVFLGELSTVDANAVLDFLIGRVEGGAEGRRDRRDFTPIPYLWEESSPLRFRESPNFLGALHRMLAWVLDEGHSGRKAFWGPLLFKAVAMPFDQVVTQVLSDWLLSSESAKIKAAATVLEHAPAALVWENFGWVCSVLENADSVSSECYSKVASAFHSAVISGVRSGTPGKPFPQDVEQRDRSAEFASKLPIGSPAQRFFLGLKKSAEDSIRWSIERDEEDRPR